MAHIIFKSGVLLVPRTKTVLQKLLSLYHPHRGKLYREFKPEVRAASEIDFLEMEIKALNAAQNLEIDMVEAVMRVEIGSGVSTWVLKNLNEIYYYMLRKTQDYF